jgi:pseudaminic acid biosynthesis-associated methylase
MQAQLEQWQGQFGRDYTDRNVIDWKVRVPAFQRMVGDLPLTTLLEVGCNRGHNLVALRDIFGTRAEVHGVEPNPFARQIATQTLGARSISAGNGYQLPFSDDSFDLVFTAGVLIHVPMTDLGKMLDEIHRVSARYLLAVEYFAEQETVISYRGRNDLLWKRNFLAGYQDRFPNLNLVRSGSVDEADGFDVCGWWLLEKTCK